MSWRNSIASIRSCLRATRPMPRKRRCCAFLVSIEKVITAKAEDGKLAIAIPIGAERHRVDRIRFAPSAFVDLVHTVVNSNDFSLSLLNFNKDFEKGNDAHEHSIASGIAIQSAVYGLGGLTLSAAYAGQAV